MSEEHNIRLTQTVDKLLAESNERLQQHLNERMNSLDEKNILSQEGDRLKKQIEDLETERDRAVIEIERLKLDIETMRKEILNMQAKQKDLSNQYTNALNLNNSLTTTINSLNKSMGNVGAKLNGEFITNSNGHYYSSEQVENGINSIDLNGLNNSIYQQQNNSPSYSANSLKGRGGRQPIHSRIQQYLSSELASNELSLDGNNCDWDKLEEAAKVIANVQHAFEMSDNENANNIEFNDEEYQHLNHRNQYQNGNVRSLNTPSKMSPYVKLPMGGSNSTSNTPVNTLIMPSGSQSAHNLNKIGGKIVGPQIIGPHTDAQTIALLLQKQLEDIDNEIRLIKEEKQNTELRAEELESRVNNIDENSPDVDMISGRSTPSQSKPDFYKMGLVKDIYASNKCYTAPPGMSSKYMEIYGHEYNENEQLNNYEMDMGYNDKYSSMYIKPDPHFNKQYDTMGHHYTIENNGFNK